MCIRDRAYAYSDEPTGGYEETDPAPTDDDVTVEEGPCLLYTSRCV